MQNRFLTKEIFIETIEALRDQYDIDCKNAKTLGEVLKSDINPMDNSKLSEHIFKILYLHFPPGEDGCEIKNFCYALNFGRTWTKFNQHPKGETKISIEELWEGLVIKKFNNQPLLSVKYRDIPIHYLDEALVYASSRIGLKVTDEPKKMFYGNIEIKPYYDHPIFISTIKPIVNQLDLLIIKKRHLENNLLSNEIKKEPLKPINKAIDHYMEQLKIIISENNGN